MSKLEEYEEHAINMRFGAGHFSTVSRNRADAMRDELLAAIAELEAENRLLNEARENANAATFRVEAELEALKGRIIQAHFYRLPVIALDVETDEGGVHWIDGMSAAEVLAIIHDDAPAPVYESVPKARAEEGARMSDYLNADPEDYAEAVAWFNECKARRARDKARIAELEADLAEEARQADEAVDSCRERIAELEAELERLDSFDVGLDAALAKLEAENERLLNLNVAMLDAVAGQEAELAALKGRRCHNCESWDAECAEEVAAVWFAWCKNGMATKEFKSTVVSEGWLCPLWTERRTK